MGLSLLHPAQTAQGQQEPSNCIAGGASPGLLTLAPSLSLCRLLWEVSPPHRTPLVKTAEREEEADETGVQADGTSVVREMKTNGVGGCLKSYVIRAKKEVEFWRKTEP